MRRLLALSLAVPAAVLLAAPAASAGCAEDYLISSNPPPRYYSISIAGPSVTVHDEVLVANLERGVEKTVVFVECVA